MKQNNPSEVKKDAQNKSTQVRGSALKEKMIESEIYGEEYRAAHQGADIVKPAGSAPDQKKSQTSK